MIFSHEEASKGGGELNDLDVAAVFGIKGLAAKQI